MFKKKGIFALVDQLVISGGNFLIVILASRILSEDVFGIFGYILTLYLLSVTVNMALIFQLANVVYNQIEDKGLFHSVALSYQALIAFVSSFIYSTIIYFLIGVEYGEVYGYILIYMYFLFQQFNDFGRRISYVVDNEKNALLYSVVTISSRLGLIFLLGDSTDGLYLALFLSVLPTGLYQVCRLLTRHLICDISLIHKSFFKNSKWLVLSVPFIWYWCNAPVFVLGWVKGLELVGVFVALRSISNVGNVLLEMLETKGAVLYAKFHFTDDLSIERVHDVVIKFMIAFWLSVFLVFGFFGSFLLSLIFGPDYVQYHNVLLGLWVMQAFVFMFRTGNVYFRTQDQSVRVFVGYFSGSMIVSASVYLLVDNFGLIGVVLTLLLGAMSIFISQKTLIGIKGSA